MNPSNDWQLWQRASQGDQRSATLLVRSLTPQALGLALQMLRHSPDAEDVVQESFLRLWNSQPDNDRGAGLATFFNTIVINRCKSVLTKRRELSADHDTLTAMADQQQMEQSGFEPGGTSESTGHAQLNQAMQSLPARQRMALAMWAYADADVGTIARTLELETNATHQLLHRAKTRLRQLLTGGQT